MKTLPTGWAALINGSFTVAYMIQITTRDGIYFRWSTIDTADIATWTGTAFDIGRIAKGGLGKVNFSIDLRSGGGLGTVGDYQFKILNHDGFYEAYLKPVALDNSTIEIKRFLVEAAPIAFSGGLTVFKGIVSDVWCDEEYIFFRCAADENEHTMIPRTVIEESTIATAEFGATRMIPENSKGKVIPIQFGEIPKAEAFFCNADTTPIGTPSVVTGAGDNYIDDSTKSWTPDEHIGKDLEIIGGTGKGQIQSIADNSPTQLIIDDRFSTNPAADGSIYRISDTEFDMILSDEKIKEFTVDVLGNKQFWFWDDTAKIYVPMNPHVLEALNDAHPFHNLVGWRFLAGIVKKNEIKFFYPYPFTEIIDNIYWTDENECIDWDVSALSHASEIITGGIIHDITGWMRTDLHDTIGSWDELFIYVIFEHDNAGVVATVTGYVNDAAGNLITPPGAKVELGSGYLYFNNVFKYILTPPSGFPSAANAKLLNMTAALDSGDWATLGYNRKFTLQPDGGISAGDNYNIKLYEFGLMFAKNIAINEKTKFFTSIKGRMFADAWGRGKGLTDLIENPADVTEKILRDDLGVTDIDTAAFDAANALRTGEKLAYSITKEINSLQEIKGITSESMLAYWKRYDGKHTLRALELDIGTVKTVGISQILVDENSKVSTFGVRMSDLDAVMNDFYIHYDKDPATNEYHGLFFVKKPAEAVYDATFTNITAADEAEHYWTLCRQSYIKYGFTRTKHIYLDRVKAAATAELFIKRMIWWLFLRVADVTFRSQLELCDLEICDVIVLGATHRLGNFMVSMVEEDLDADTIAFKARELTNKENYGKWYLTDGTDHLTDGTDHLTT